MSESLTVLQVIPRLDTGGAERTTLEIAGAVTRAGGVALAASEGGRLEAEFAELGGRLVRLPMATKNPVTALVNAFRLARVIRRENVDIVHARSRAPAWSAFLAARMSGAAFVTTYHGVYAGRSQAKNFYNSVMARGDAVIANSRFTSDHLLERHDVHPERVTVIHRGVDLARFAPGAEVEARARALRADWGVPAGRFTAILPARLTRWKGQLVAIEALAARKAAGAPPPFLVLAGDDQGRTEYRDEIAAAIAAHGLEGDVLIAGHCEDLPAAFALADLALCPSTDPEAFGRAAAEAQAAGLPVIAADHGGAREVVLPGRTGWLVAPGDAEALAAAIGEAMGASRAERAAMGAAGLARAQSLFSDAALQAATLQVYRDLLGSRRNQS